MTFNSWHFILFVGIVLALYFRLSLRGQNRLLFAASYFFYGYWDYRFLGLILITTLIVYGAAILIEDAKSARDRKRWLTLACAASLGILGVFKYYDFFVSSAESLLATIGFHPPDFRLNLILPIGISFYTFQAMSYAIDVYRRRVRCERQFFMLALYVAFFPQLVAGPIERAAHLLPQLKNRRIVSERHWVEGGWLILWGYFQKVFVADNLAIMVDRTVSYQSSPSGLVCLLAMYCFLFQVYADFGGYSNIARGVARLFGIELRRNFAFPLTASNPAEFWRRWHISLSTWLRDYLYIPLMRNREERGRLFTYRNLMITLILAGLWHGASWTYVAWGVYMGFLLVLHRALMVDFGLISFRKPFGKALSFLAFFHLNVAGVFLVRSTSVAQFGEYLRQIVTDFYPDPDAAEILVYLLVFAGSMFLLEFWHRDRADPRTFPGWNLATGALVCSGLVFMICLLAPSHGSQFFYFQF